MLEQQLVVGRTYRFTFKSEFERHGVCSTEGAVCLHKGSGVFTLKQIATYQDLASAGISIYDSFFKPLNITEEEFKAYFSGKPANSYTPVYTTVPVHTENTVVESVYDDTTHQVSHMQRKVVGQSAQIVESGESVLKRQFIEELCYGSFPIYKLVDVVDTDDVLYVPEKAIKGFPEVSIKAYQDLTLSLELGYYENPTDLDGLLNNLRERLAVFGIQPLKMNLFSSSERWMNPDEYEAVKTMRVPGERVKITSLNQNTYLNCEAVVDGTLKTIKTKVTNADTQISLDSVICQPQTIDPRIFLREMDPFNELIFESGKQYYVRTNNYSSTNEEYRRLVENEDWAPGDVVTHFKTFTGSRSSGTKYYKNVGTRYTALAPDGTGELAKSLSASGVSVYRGTYTQQVSTDKALAGVEYYSRAEASNGSIIWTKVNPTVGSTLNSNYYKLETAYVTVDSAYIDAHPFEVYYVKSSGNQFVEDNASGTYVRNMVYVLDYASDAAVDLIAKHFKYTNHLNALIDIELSADDIVDLALDESDKVVIANDIAERMYEGRWFEYTKMTQCKTSDRAIGGKTYYYHVNGEYVPATNVVAGASLSASLFQADMINVIINPSNFNAFKTYEGVVIGHTGEAWRMTFVKSTNTTNNELKKNYFALYTSLLNTQQELIARNQSLQELVNAQRRRLAALEA